MPCSRTRPRSASTTRWPGFLNQLLAAGRDLAHQLTGGVPHVDGVSQAQAAKLTVAGHDAFIYGFSHAMTMSVAVAMFGVVIAFLLIRGHGASLDEEIIPLQAGKRLLWRKKRSR